MDHDRLLNSTFQCQCGKTHSVPVRQIVYSEEAVAAIPDTLAAFTPGRRVLILADQRTWSVAGEEAAWALQQGGWDVSHTIVGDTQHGGPVCDDHTFEVLNAQLLPADILLAVGAGVINDLTKWLAAERDLPYAVLATAATMNGYTAANVAPTIKGVKTLHVARAPLAVFAIPSVLSDAPFELTAAGLGDVLAKPVSTADWLMNHLFLGEYFCPFCARLINDLEPTYLDNPAAIREREPAALAALFNALVYSGIAMTVVGTSAPASGGEHMLSHTLDMMSSVDAVPHDLHGRQVGLGTIFACALYEQVLAIDTPEPVALPQSIDSSFWRHLAPNVAEQYRNKQPLMKTIAEKITDPQTWNNFRDAVGAHVRAPQEIKDCLSKAGAAHAYADINCTRDRLKAAILHMHEIRKRPTVVDLAWLLGILPQATDHLVDQYLAA
ncbi:MAG TPA: iron-containing alcohol dehydrogenase [Anaerohalosphaeraceae bacterium]|jgi:glycerol-1-phosphate dehydrogenase [NAD(P)+]|nr:iron-containing alcohol dehydrogenase [Anaerohalosphaeraceae bacterium]HRT49328.1 iron-containing alcohol dehydrogenase [Anaerohalosphaeraceae bacterium]HRT85943.1 iron-containing alcohol dehydrogenase [Anaerohalosphaeraceae bacterium]